MLFDSAARTACTSKTTRMYEFGKSLLARFAFAHFDVFALVRFALVGEEIHVITHCTTLEVTIVYCLDLGGGRYDRF